MIVRMKTRILQEESEEQECVSMSVKDKEKPWKVGGKEPKVSISNSTESIL